MITICKKRSFFELFDNDAIIINFLFGYKIFVMDSHIMMHISSKQLDTVKTFLDDKKISHQIITDECEVKLFNYKNTNYNILIQKTQKEFPSAYELKTKLEELRNYIEEMNNFEPKYSQIAFVSDINSLIDNDKKLNFENIINDYRRKNPIDYSHAAFVKKPEIITPKPFTDQTKVIRSGSKVTIQQEDSSMTEEYIIVDEPISYNDSGYISSSSSFGQMLIGKSEWDFFEYKNKSFQIIEVDNS